MHHTPYIMHHTPCTIHHTIYTIHLAPYTTQCTPYTMHHTPCTIHHKIYTIRHTMYTIHHAPYTTQCTPYTMHHAPHNVQHTPCTMHHTLYTSYTLCTALLDYCQLPNKSINALRFMQPGSSLPSSKQPTTCPYPEPVKSNYNTHSIAPTSTLNYLLAYDPFTLSRQKPAAGM